MPGIGLSTSSQCSDLLRDLCQTLCETHKIFFISAYRAVDADPSVCYARRTRGFIGDVSNLAPVSSNFSLVSTCLLRVILSV
jgi:hypothetical protein